MPRKKITEEKARPIYLNADGTLEVSKIFTHNVKQTELLQIRTRDGFPYIMTRAPQCLSVGGFRSGKTVGWLMYFVMNYCLAYENCDILVLRRTFKELESGAIKDFHTFVPSELYKYDATRHVATFMNGSRIVFGHCANNKMRDIEQYLGSAYPGILVDECGQFSPDAWGMLYSRNIVNAACVPDAHNHLPIPVIVGCTNPLGPYYEYYRTVFVQKEPFEKPEGAKKDANGAWWTPETGDWETSTEPLNIYDPALYAYQRSTAMDNPKFLERDPGFIARMNSLPKAQRDKKLLGLDGAAEGQYFECFDPYNHVIDLREDPDAIIWQNWQPVWGSQDWGMGHANAGYLFTKAMVKTIGSNYKLKTVCIRETVTSGKKTDKEWASLFKAMCKLPNGEAIRPKAIFFSHEKFNKQMKIHSPADEYSIELRALGLPAVTRATQDRIGGASMIYNMLRNGDLVILDTCREIINAFPSLMRDPDNIDDVLKVSTRGDDCYDAFRYGIYGMYKPRKEPEENAIEEHAQKLDPLAAHFYRLKMQSEKEKRQVMFTQKEVPVWQTKCGLE